VRAGLNSISGGVEEKLDAQLELLVEMLSSSMAEWLEARELFAEGSQWDHHFMETQPINVQQYRIKNEDNSEAQMPPVFTSRVYEYIFNSANFLDLAAEFSGELSIEL
jgi:hypothetical protein